MDNRSMGNTAKILGEYLRSVFFGKTDAKLAVSELDEEFKSFGEGLSYFAECFFEYNKLAKALSVGDLSVPLPAKGNVLVDSLKSLHASLKHLTWQTQQVAKGDYSQHIDFMGDFSAAFNTMVEQLAERQHHLEQVNFNLQWAVDAKTKTVMELQSALLKTMSELIDCRDDTTGGHIERTQAYLNILLNSITDSNLHQEEVSAWNKGLVLQSAQLHDLGKIAIEDTILKKPGRLTYDEFEKIKIHTIFGRDVIERIKLNAAEHDFLDYASVFAISHHEKWDGNGYPHGLKGEAIPLLGRLLAIADVYDALTSERPYKEAFSHEKAADIICDSSGTHFEPSLVSLFAEESEKFRAAAAVYK